MDALLTHTHFRRRSTLVYLELGWTIRHIIPLSAFEMDVHVFKERQKLGLDTYFRRPIQTKGGNALISAGEEPSNVHRSTGKLWTCLLTLFQIRMAPNERICGVHQPMRCAPLLSNADRTDHELCVDDADGNVSSYWLSFRTRVALWKRTMN